MLPTEVHLHQGFTGMQFQPFTDILMGNRVMVLIELDVIVNVDLDRLDRNVLVGLGG